MKLHRIRQSKSIDGSGKPHIFIEIESDRWLEIKSLESITHKSIEDFIKGEHKLGIFHLGYSTRAFEIGLITDWEDIGEIF